MTPKESTDFPKGERLRRYKMRNKIKAYKSDWSRKTGLRRILPRVGAKVTPKSIGAIVKHPVLSLRMTLVRLGHFFWQPTVYRLVHRCRAAPHKCLPSWRMECIRQNKRNRQRAIEMYNAPSGWDMFD